MIAVYASTLQIFVQLQSILELSLEFSFLGDWNYSAHKQVCSWRDQDWKRALNGSLYLYKQWVKIGKQKLIGLDN